VLFVVMLGSAGERPGKDTQALRRALEHH
jgi:hypothetical protein